MPRIRQIKTNFTSGEISPNLLGRGDLSAYENGAKRLRNVHVFPTGGISRRPGLRLIDIASGNGRLIDFEFNIEQTYLMVFTNKKVTIYANDIKLESKETPWSEQQLKQIIWTQSADTLLICHPDVEPQKLIRTRNGSFIIEPWQFYQNNNISYQPFYKFGNDNITLRPNRTSGNITISASANIFSQNHVNCYFKIADKQVLITSVNANGLSARARVKQNLINTSATKDWQEQAFSPARGWPVSCIFHQDRLVIGGSRNLPNRLWLSKSSDLFNFDLGTGKDDEAIEFAILSDQVNAIRAVFSARHLQVLTSGAEWMVTGDPLTPKSIQLKRQTRVGSPTDRYVPPMDVDGATLYVSRTGKELREFLFTDMEQAYQSNDLAMLAGHIVKNPIDQAFMKNTRLLYQVMEDGTLATVTVFRPESVTAWSVQETDGDFKSVSVVGESVYILVKRGDGDNAIYTIEIFDDNFNTDSGNKFTASHDNQKTWSKALPHLALNKVKIIADGIVREDIIISKDGSIILEQPAKTIEAGIGYTHEIEPLPAYQQGMIGIGQGTPIRLVKAVFRLLNTSALEVNTGNGTNPVPFKRLTKTGVLDYPIPNFTGDKTVRALGWQRGEPKPLWLVEQEIPLPCTILSILTEISSPIN